MKEKLNNIKEFFRNLDKKMKTLIIIIIILILILSGLLIYYFVSKDNVKKEKEKPVSIEVKDNFAYSDGKLFFYDGEKKLGEYTCVNKNSDNCYVAFLSTEDNFTLPINVDENSKKIDVRSDLYLDQYAFVFDNQDGENVIVLYDFKNEEKKGSYTVIKSNAINDYIILKNLDGKYGLVSIKEKEISIIVDFEYEYLGKLVGIEEDDKILIAKKNGNYSLINYENKSLTKSVKNPIVNYNEKYILTKNEKEIYSVYDYKGELIIDNYVFIELLKDYVLAIDETNKLMVLDYGNNRYLGEGIQLKNKNYIKSNIYNDKLVKKETLYAFTYTLVGSSLNIYVKNNDNEVEYVVDLNEGIYSKDLNYSYFDNKLYFYKDDTKQELLGSYKCKNPNIISEKKYFCSTNIKTASKNSVLFNKYVIILDTSSTGDTEIKYYLYDIVENKLKGNFIEMYLDGDVNLEIGTSSASFFVVSKSNKMGIIKINKDGIDNFIKLENDDIRRFDDYYLIENSSKYILKDLNGISIVSTPFTYIELKDNYMIVVNEDNLLLYDYTGKQIIANSVKLNTKLYQFESYNINNIYLVTEKDKYYIIDNIVEKFYFSKTDGSSLSETDALTLGE